MTIKEIRKLTGLTQANFAEKYHIPLDNIRSWETGRKKAADYLIELLEFKVIYDERLIKEKSNDFKEKTFTETFQELEKRGIQEVSIYNRNCNYITDTPYWQGSMEYFRDENIYKSKNKILDCVIDEEDSWAIIYYNK